MRGVTSIHHERFDHYDFLGILMFMWPYVCPTQTKFVGSRLRSFLSCSMRFSPVKIRAMYDWIGRT